MDDLKVDIEKLCFLDAKASDLILPVAPSVAEWTEAQMRELLESVENFTISPVSTEMEKERRIHRCAERLYSAVSMGDSAEMIRVMCDLSNAELRDVVAIVVTALETRGLKSIAVRVDDFDRIVLFDEERNKGFAVAPSGSYQRVSRFYDGSYRYGIELLLDAALKTSVDAIFREIKAQIA